MRDMIGRLRPWLEQRWWLAASGAIVLIAVVGVAIWQLTSAGSSHPVEAEPSTPAVVEGGPTDPSEPRELPEVVIAEPGSESATEDQLEQQITTNAQSGDPTYAHRTTCSHLSSYSHFDHYFCLLISLGKGGVGKITVTVDQNTGAVSAEIGSPGESGATPAPGSESSEPESYGGEESYGGYGEESYGEEEEYGGSESYGGSEPYGGEG